MFRITYDLANGSEKRLLVLFHNLPQTLTTTHFLTVQACAETNGESLNGFVNRAIDETVERDKKAGE